jgi:hypothetical protein
LPKLAVGLVLVFGGGWMLWLDKKRKTQEEEAENGGANEAEQAEPQDNAQPSS